MRFFADLHIHSPYSRATSKQSNLEILSIYGQIKGIALLGTGDCIHPGYLSEIKGKLIPSEDGFYTLKPGLLPKSEMQKVSSDLVNPTRFLLSTEISNIYKKNRQVRKVHNVICLSSIETAQKLSTRLDQIGNIRSDGRPILGLDSKNLLEITLEIDENAIFIPAHIWTPWFSVLGSKSGFDSIEECFDDLTKYIYAVETGLSSDPLMNWQLTNLDKFKLVSFSDAHSPSKLGRECTIFDTEFNYPSILKALSQHNNGFAGTVEFFPEEGKYHYDGHRKCGFRCTPDESEKLNNVCPVCHKELTIGVMKRIYELADQPLGRKPNKHSPFTNCIPLAEIIAESLGMNPESQKVQTAYSKLIESCGSEFTILLDTSIEQIASASDPVIAEGVKRMRSGNVLIEPGYDGEFGIIKIFTEQERADLQSKSSLFKVKKTANQSKTATTKHTYK